MAPGGFLGEWTPVLGTLGSLLFSGLLVYLYFRQTRLSAAQKEMVERQTEIMAQQTELMESQSRSELYYMGTVDVDGDEIRLEVANIGNSPAGVALETELDYEFDHEFLDRDDVDEPSSYPSEEFLEKYERGEVLNSLHPVQRNELIEFASSDGRGNDVIVPRETAELTATVRLQFATLDRVTSAIVGRSRPFAEAVEVLYGYGVRNVEVRIRLLKHDVVTEDRVVAANVWAANVDIEPGMTFEDIHTGEGVNHVYKTKRQHFQEFPWG